MNRENIEKLIEDIAINRNGIMLLNYNQANETVEMCEKNRIDILGIEAFSLHENSIQPCLDKSVDFTSDFEKRADTPKEFFEKTDDHEKNLLFEIVL